MRQDFVFITFTDAVTKYLTNLLKEGGAYLGSWIEGI